MRHFILFIALFSIGLTTINAQNTGVAFELHYPLTMADKGNFATEVNGLLGGAVGFQISDNIDFNYGLKYKFDQLIFNTTYDNSQNVTRTSFMMHHVNGFGTYSINDTGTLKAVLEGGLSFYKYKKSNLQPSFFGFNISPGLNLEFRNQFYLFLNYSFIKTKLKRRQTGFIENEKMNTVRLGVGFKL